MAGARYSSPSRIPFSFSRLLGPPFLSERVMSGAYRQYFETQYSARLEKAA